MSRRHKNQSTSIAAPAGRSSNSTVVGQAVLCRSKNLVSGWVHLRCTEEEVFCRDHSKWKS